MLQRRTIGAVLLAGALIVVAVPTGGQAQATGDRTETELETTEAIGRTDAGGTLVYVPAFQAQLTTADGEPIQGETLRFEVDGSHACSAETSESGYGYCFAPAFTPLAIADGGYDAIFEATEDWQGSTDRAHLATVFGEEIGG